MNAFQKMIWLFVRPFVYFLTIGILAMAFCYYHAENDPITSAAHLVVAIFICFTITRYERLFKQKTEG